MVPSARLRLLEARRLRHTGPSIARLADGT